MCNPREREISKNSLTLQATSFELQEDGNTNAEKSKTPEMA